MRTWPRIRTVGAGFLLHRRNDRRIRINQRLLADSYCRLPRPRRARIRLERDLPVGIDTLVDRASVRAAGDQQQTCRGEWAKPALPSGMPTRIIVRRIDEHDRPRMVFGMIHRSSYWNHRHAAA